MLWSISYNAQEIGLKLTTVSRWCAAPITAPPSHLPCLTGNHARETGLRASCLPLSLPLSSLSLALSLSLSPSSLSLFLSLSLYLSPSSSLPQALSLSILCLLGQPGVCNISTSSIRVLSQVPRQPTKAVRPLSPDQWTSTFFFKNQRGGTPAFVSSVFSFSIQTMIPHLREAHPCDFLEPGLLPKL